jgi:hypothetical protein
MSSDIHLIRPLIHLAVDLGTDYLSGLAHFNHDHAYKLPPDIEAFSAKLHALDITTVWTGSTAGDLSLRPSTPENISLTPTDRKLVVSTNPNDWLSSKKVSSALSNPELRKQLAKWKTQYVILTGLSIEACLRDTMIHLLGRGIHCLVPVDLIAAYMGTAVYGSVEFKTWNKEAMLALYDSLSTKYRLRGDLTLTSSEEILALVQKRKRPVHEEPAFISHVG